MCALTLVGACGGDGGTETNSGSTGTGSTASDPSGTPPTSETTQAGGSETADAETANPTTGDPTTGSTGDPTGGGESHRICDLYLNCLAVIAPTELPDAQQGFGPNGTCWQGDEASAQQCIAACQSGLETWHNYDPSEPACWLCQAPTDCPEGQVCEVGECKPGAVTGCGDGVVDPDEICDGQPGCDADCLGPAQCSPLTGAGCKDGEMCLFTAGSDPKCTASAALPQLGEPCDANTNEVCAEGLVCAPPEFAPDCPPQGCCIAFCNFQGDMACPGDGGCTPNFGLVTTPGLDYLGLCP